MVAALAVARELQAGARGKAMVSSNVPGCGEEDRADRRI